MKRSTGKNFNQKLENLITRCVWELPAKEEELAQLEKRIQEKRELLRQMTTQAGELHMTINDLASKIRQLNISINQAIEKWNL